MRILYVCLALLVCLLLSSNLSAQSIEYEELATLPVTEIDYVAVAPYGGIFVRSDGVLYRSVDDGATWIQYNNFPDGFRPSSVDFLGDGTAIISGNYDGPISAKLIFRDGGWHDLFHDHFGWNDSRILGNNIYIIRSDTIYKSEDRGRSYSMHLFNHDSHDIDDIFRINNKHFLILESNEPGIQFSGYTLEEYDLDFNFIGVRPLPSELDRISFRLLVNGDDILFYDLYNDFLLYSYDEGRTFTERQVGRILYGLSIVNNAFIALQADTLFSLTLDNDFLTNPLLPYDTLEIFEGVKPFNKHLAIKGDNYIKIRDIRSETEFAVYDFPFQSRRARKVRIDDSDNIYASTRNFLFKSNDEGLSWQNIYGSYTKRISSWTLSEEGGIVLSMSNLYRNVSVDALYISPDGNIDEWDISLLRPEVFYLDEGRYRVVTGYSSCNASDTQIFISEDGGPFEEYILDVSDCLSENMDAVFYDNKIYLFGDDHTDEGIYHTIDVMNNFNIEKIRLNTDVFPAIQYYSHITAAGEIFVYPKAKFSTNENDELYQVYYSPNISETDLIPIGQAPQGRLVQNDADDLAFVIQADGQLFIKSAEDISYSKIETKNQDFNWFSNGDIDSQGRLVITVQDGRILRAVTDGLSTSIADEEAFFFSISPNPVIDDLHIVLADSKPHICTVSNVSGSIVHHSKHNESVIDVDMNDMERGVYFLSVVDVSGHRVTRKFVKM